MNHEVLLSIIIPVYNLEMYVEDCIRSIERIEAPKELICVNDGSADQSLPVLQKLAGEFDDIIIVDQENTGVSKARNNGVQLARGKYICFFDGDDLVVAETIDRAVRLLEDEKADCVTYDYQNIAENYKCEDWTSIIPCHPCSAVSHDPSRLYGKGYIWHLIMRKDIIDTHAIAFPDMRYFEDKYFLMDYCIHCNRVIILPEIGYLYRVRQSSAMRNPARAKLWTVDAIKAAAHMDLLANHSPEGSYKDACLKAKQLFILHAMTMGIMVPEYNAGTVIQQLRDHGLFPFPPMWRLLVPNGTSTVLNYLRLGFCSKIYYSLFSMAVRIARKVR